MKRHSLCEAVDGGDVDGGDASPGSAKPVRAASMGETIVVNSLVFTGPQATIQNGRISRNGEFGILAVDMVLGAERIYLPTVRR